MPTVHNPSKFNLWCEPADKEVPAGRKIEVSDDGGGQGVALRLHRLY